MAQIYFVLHKFSLLIETFVNEYFRWKFKLGQQYNTENNSMLKLF